MTATQTPPSPKNQAFRRGLAGMVAKAAGIPRTRIERIMREETGISADTALRLGKVLATSPEFWVNLQARYDLLTAQELVGAELDGIKALRAA